MFRFLGTCFSIIVHAFLALAVLAAYLYTLLPDITSLKNVTYQQPLTVYTHTGEYLATYGEIHRIPVKMDQVPSKLVAAFLSTEDQRFYKHHGIDFFGIARAVKSLAITGRKSQGASTITMQVARNFFLGREKTYYRKSTEIMLALAIEKGLTKEEILELYLNKIYLGQRAYGVAAAAKIYFGKNLDELSIAQMALIAGLPKAPSEYNPKKNVEAALKRRNFVLKQMRKHKHINDQEFFQAKHEPIETTTHDLRGEQEVGYASELARIAMVEKFGDKAYQEGFKIYITIDKAKQQKAQEALAKGLEQFDRQKGLRPAQVNLHKKVGPNVEKWQSYLAKEPSTPTGYTPAAVLTSLADSLWVLQSNNERVMVTLPKDPKNHTEFAPGDLIYTQKVEGVWHLRQIPNVQGALVSINPQTCRLEAMIGGYQFQRSNFNRAIQASRQAGSVIKPLVYAVALENGYNMASMINDAPVIEEDINADNAQWRPKNVDAVFKGPVRLRQALVQSRNLVSVRLMKSIGIEKTINYLTKMGLDKNKQVHGLSLSLGAGLVTPFELARAYTVFPRQGVMCNIHWIDRIEDRNGQVISSPRMIEEIEGNVVPSLSKEDSVITPQTAYIMSNALQDVVKHGTARRAKVLGRSDISGKTGSTNDFNDAWFSGFNKNSVTAVWVGYDNAQSVKVPGAKLALPIWVDYMRATLDKHEQPIAMPKDVINMRINRKTGRAATMDDKDTMFELFTKGQEPTLQEAQNTKHDHEERENIFQ